MSKQIAVGGVTAALAITIMCVGTVFPFATFLCPILCMMLFAGVLEITGRRIGWAWYASVCILALLLAPDKEAAAIWLFLGWYPMVKPRWDRLKLGYLLKFLTFNLSILLTYWSLIRLLGMSDVLDDFSGTGSYMLLTVLLLGNVTFGMLDLVLGRLTRLWKGIKK